LCWLGQPHPGGPARYPFSPAWEGQSRVLAGAARARRPRVRGAWGLEPASRIWRGPLHRPFPHRRGERPELPAAAQREHPGGLHFLTRPAQPAGSSRGRGGLVLIAAAVAAAAAVVAFVAAHIVLLAVCAAVFVAGMGGFLAWCRWAASPQRLRAHYCPRPTVRALAARPAQAIPATRPRAIEAPRRQLPARAARPGTIQVRRSR
jgi:hypothetical protein